MTHTISITPQRFCLRTGVWSQCLPHKAQAWQVFVGKTPDKRFNNKSAALGYADKQLRLATKPPTQTLNQRYDLRNYRGAIFSSKPQPTTATKGAKS